MSRSIRDGGGAIAALDPTDKETNNGQLNSTTLLSKLTIAYCLTCQ